MATIQFRYTMFGFGSGVWSGRGDGQAAGCDTLICGFDTESGYGFNSYDAEYQQMYAGYGNILTAGFGTGDAQGMGTTYCSGTGEGSRCGGGYETKNGEG